MLMTELPTDLLIDQQEVMEKVSVFRSYLETLPEKAIALGVRVLIALLVLFIGSKLIKLLLKLMDRGMEKGQVELGVRQFIKSLVKAVCYVLLIFFIAAELGVNTASIVAVLGSAGIAVGLALQGSLSNLAGGVLILILKPFVIGEYISESGSGKEGTVTEIHIFYTKLRTFDHKVVVLPNGSLSNVTITNYSREKMRRVDVKVSVSYSADLEKSREVLLGVMNSHEKVLKTMERMVAVEELADSGVNLVVRCWCLNPDYWTVFFELTEKCKLALDAAGVEIPFPQVDVHMR